MLIKLLCVQARARLENGYYIGFLEYGQDQAVYPAMPPLRWYHMWALRYE